MLTNTPLSEKAVMTESEAFAALAKSLRELGFKLIDVPSGEGSQIGGLLWEKDGKRFFQNLDNVVEVR
jgi:hypothetical protein